VATVTLTPVVPRGARLVVELADDAYRAGGDSTWEEVVRPRREAGLEYTGTSARMLILPGIFDGVGKSSAEVGRGAQRHEVSVDSSVEPECARLEQFARRTATTGEPYVLYAEGAAPTGSLKWVIDSLAWDEHPLLLGNGSRCQQLVTVSLKEWQPVTSLITEPRSKKGARSHTTKVMKSDLPGGLKKVSARTLGTAARWHEIAAINKNKRGKVIRDPADVYVGQELRLP
jgi:hypothetical protein